MISSLANYSISRYIVHFLAVIRCCRGTQKVSLSNAISLLKSRFLPRFTAICRAEKVVNKL